MRKIEQAKFDDFAASLIGLPVSLVWRGHGSALFLEFGKLKQQFHRDGRKLDSKGQMGLMIQGSWRIEDARSILCGSWSDEPKWPKAFAKLRKTEVVGVSLFGRLPEIDVELSNGLHVVSFSTTDGDPQWAILREETELSLGVKRGALHVEKFARAGRAIRG